MKAYHDHKEDFSSHSCSGVMATGIMLGKPPGVTTTNTLGMEQKENQAVMGPGWWYIFPPYLHTIVTNVCICLPPHKQQVVLPSPYLCMWTMDLHWLSLVILKESHQKVLI